MESTKRRPRVIWGAKAIGAFIGVDLQKAYYLLQRGRIPARKVGDEWVAEEGQLLSFFAGSSSASNGTETAGTEEVGTDAA